jgi:hypothetical protein
MDKAHVKEKEVKGLSVWGEGVAAREGIMGIAEARWDILVLSPVADRGVSEQISVRGA